MVRNSEEFERAKRQVANCPTDALLKVAKDPIQASNPHQRALNAEFQELVAAELQERGVAIG